jgi:hypothetical protein
VGRGRRLRSCWRRLTRWGKSTRGWRRTSSTTTPPTRPGSTRCGQSVGSVRECEGIWGGLAGVGDAQDADGPAWPPAPGARSRDIDPATPACAGQSHARAVTAGMARIMHGLRLRCDRNLRQTGGRVVQHHAPLGADGAKHGGSKASCVARWGMGGGAVRRQSWRHEVLSTPEGRGEVAREACGYESSRGAWGGRRD